VIHTDPLPGDVGLTQIHGPVGAFIRVGQWANGNGFADYEHAFLVLPDGRLLQAEPGGARMASLEEYVGGHTLYAYPVGLTDEQRVAICTAAARHVGVPYSFLDYAAIGAHRFRLPVPGLRRYVASTRHMICSQLVDQCYQDAGVHLFNDNRWPGYVTPEALYDLLAREERGERQRAAA
jgi:uncharacterized protein YycO